MTLDCELRTFDAINNSRLSRTSKNIVRELKALDVINNSRSWMT